MGDGAESGSLSVSSWSVDSITAFSSSSSSMQLNRGEQVELHELSLLRSVVRSIYMDSADDKDESDVEGADEAQVPTEGGLRPFIPPLVSSPIQLETVPEGDESSSSNEHFYTLQNRVSLVADRYRSELARSFQSQLAQELASDEDYNISALWPDTVDENTVERVSKFKCYISPFSF